MNKLFIHENHAHERETHTVSTHRMFCFSRLAAHARRDRAASRNLIPMLIGLFQQHRAFARKFKSSETTTCPHRRDRSRARARCAHRCIRTPHVCCVALRVDVGVVFGVVLGVGTIGSRVSECRHERAKRIVITPGRLSCERRFGETGCGGKRPR